MDCLSTSTVQNKKNICANLDDVGEASALVRMERLVHPVGQPCCQHAHLPVVPPFNKWCSASSSIRSISLSPSPTLTLTTRLPASPSARGTTCLWLILPWTDNCCKYWGEKVAKKTKKIKHGHRQKCKNVRTVQTSRCYFFWPVLIFGKSTRKTANVWEKRAKNC